MDRALHMISHLVHGAASASLRSAALHISIALSAVCFPTWAETTPSQVGEVTLVLGKTYRYSGLDEVEAPVTRGDSILQGDQIVTESNGHVHVRFIDGALLSVRPNSRLTIQRYDYDSNNEAESAVKFQLDSGVARSISGQAAKEARGSFRLNTPTAAIGVRGTDFVVGADSGVTRAMVNEGAIVVAPFSDECRMDGIGPCVANSLEITGRSIGIASIEQSATLPRLIPPQSVRTPAFIQAEIQRAVGSVDSPPDTQSGLSPADSRDSNSPMDQGVSGEVLLESVTTVQVRADAEVAVEKVQSSDFTPIAPISVASNGSVVGFDHTPPKLLTADQLGDRQLVWGRYFSSPTLTDRLTLTFQEASESRSTAIGTPEFGLFRAEPNGSFIQVGDGLIGFRLTSAQAVFNSQTGIVLLAVDDGSLGIDFQASSFTTSLNMYSDVTGPVDFSASGRLFDGGFLRALGSTQSLRGAISFDGSEAGYHFEKELGLGKISGLTLWDSE